MHIPTMNLAVLITCHNRRETTLACLRRLFAQELPEGAEFTVFLVDDGCTDGTGSAVKREFPSINVILGDGNLYWNQGMRRAWTCAYKAGDWDGYLWLNDDTMLLDGALRTMLETMDKQAQATGKRGIVVGSCCEPTSTEQRARSVEDSPESVEDGARGEERRAKSGEQPPAQRGLRPGGSTWSKEEVDKGGEHGARGVEDGAKGEEQRARGVEDRANPSSFIIHHSSDKMQSILSYGGRDERGLVMPTNDPQPILAFNGNFVLVSKEAFNALGNLNGAYRHSFGDIDYGIRAQKAGVPIWLAPHFQGECGRNPIAKWRDPSVRFNERWRAFRGPKGFTIRELKAFASVRGQRFWLLSVLRQHLIVLFPKLASHG